MGIVLSYLLGFIIGYILGWNVYKSVHGHEVEELKQEAQLWMDFFKAELTKVSSV